MENIITYLDGDGGKKLKKRVSETRLDSLIMAKGHTPLSVGILLLLFFFYLTTMINDCNRKTVSSEFRRQITKIPILIKL